jgi:hypothetical protein
LLLRASRSQSTGRQPRQRLSFSGMASNIISDKTFIVKQAIPSDADSRAIRRIIVHPDILAPAKLCAGDVIALINTANVEEASKVRISLYTTSPWTEETQSGVARIDSRLLLE